MTDNGKRKHGVLFSCVLFLLCRLAAHGVSFAYSAVATDILYMEGALPSILSGARSVLLWLSILVTVVAFSTLACGRSEKAPTGMAWIFTLIVFADAAGVFLTDLCGGAFRENILVWLGLAVDIGTFLLEGAFVWLVYSIARRCPTPEKAVLWTSLLHMGWRLAMETVYLIQFLIDVDFSPYPKEILSILRSYGGIVLWQGVVLFLASTLICRLRSGKSGVSDSSARKIQ